MEITISLAEMGWIVLIAVILAVCFYMIRVFRRLDVFMMRMVAISETLAQNKENLRDIIDRVAEITERGASVSKRIDMQIEDAAKTIRTIGHSTTDTVSTISKTADQISTYTIVIGEIFKLLRDIFAPAVKAAESNSQPRQENSRPEVP